MPHIGVSNIASLDWAALKKAGFQGCVFDKDNTLTEPYAHVVAPQLAESLEACKRHFNGQLVVYSNSAGLREFDPEGATLTTRPSGHHLQVSVTIKHAH